jgi:aquaporin Z
MKKLLAELIGTAVLVLLGCGSAVLGPWAGGSETSFPYIFDQLAVSFAFGLAIVAMAYGIGPISGCHVNPAVSLGAYIAGRMPLNEMFSYWAAQFIGAVVGAGILFGIASGRPEFHMGPYALGSNGFGDDYNGHYSLAAAFLFEVVATFIFLVVILGSTQARAPGAFAGLAIGLTLVVIHIVGIQVTGVSVNPARSFGPAVFAGGQALGQLWLFILAPLVGAAMAGALFRVKLLEADGVTVEAMEATPAQAQLKT